MLILKKLNKLVRLASEHLVHFVNCIITVPLSGIKNNSKWDFSNNKKVKQTETQNQTLLTHEIKLIVIPTKLSHESWVIQWIGYTR